MWDTCDVRHITKYALYINEDIAPIANLGTDMVAPGVMLTSRLVESESVWWIKLKQKILLIPIIGLLFKKKNNK